MNMSKEEHAKMTAKMGDSKTKNDPTMDMSKMDPANNMQHGNAPMGMAGHDHHKMMIADFKKRFYIVLALTIPIMLLSPMIQHFMGVNWQFEGSNYLLFAPIIAASRTTTTSCFDTLRVNTTRRWTLFSFEQTFTYFFDKSHMKVQ